ncbi:MAG: tetratricopeptide repeat protein [Chitinophagaceae bacterium]
MKKIVSLLFIYLVTVTVSLAQTVVDGIKMLNYGKNKSANEIFKKLYDANTKDPQIIYWYGQGLLALEDVKGAKAVYQKSLQEGINDAWLLVGMGHIEIIEGGDLNSAKQKFEQAITMTTATKGKNKGKPSADILNAIGYANADGGSKQGDPLYAIDKLKQAGTIDLVNPDIFVNMGICFLKLGGDQGGEAVKAFTEAITRDPKNARAMYRIGKIYQSQGNKDLFEDYYGKAMAADVAFPLPYAELYDYYSNRDVAKARENIEKYIQYADKDCATDYVYADYLFRAGKYQESLEKAKLLETGDCKSYYRTNLLYAYNYDRLGDSINAKGYIQKHFANAPQNKIQITDYDLAVKIYSRFKGEENTTVSFLEKAMEMDSTVKNRVAYMNQAADIMGKAQKFDDQIKWMQKAVEANGGAMGEADYYKMANSALNGKNYEATMAIAKKYMAAFPDKPQPYYFNVKAAKAIDTSGALGTAVEPILQQNEYLSKDVEKNRKAIFVNLYYLLIYYNDKAKDVAKAIEVCDKMLVLYPTAGDENNAFATKTKEALSKIASKTTATKP